MSPAPLLRMAPIRASGMLRWAARRAYAPSAAPSLGVPDIRHGQWRVFQRAITCRCSGGCGWPSTTDASRGRASWIGTKGPSIPHSLTLERLLVGGSLGSNRGLLVVCAANSIGELYTRQVTFEDVDVKFARSGGAGGQNVNKVNTKVDMRLKLSTAAFLSEELKEGIRNRERNRVNNNDELVIMSTTHRTQGANKEDALERMQELIHAVADSLVVKEMTAEQAKKQQKMQRRANSRRLDDKKAHSKKKAERRRSDW